MEASIVVFTTNKAIYLEYTLESLFHQSYNKSQYEVIIVHTGDSDSTEEMIECFAARDWNFHHIKHRTLNRSMGLNVGLKASNHLVVARFIT